MNKAEKTANELQALLQGELNSSPQIIEDNATVYMPMPYVHDIDESGCNWNISTVSNAYEYEALIRAIVSKLRSEFNLKK